MKSATSVIALNYMEHVEIASLSKGVQELVAIIGISNVYTLAKIFGGQSKYVAKNYKRSTLFNILDDNHAKKLSEEYGGDFISIPSPIQIERFTRNLYIKDLIARGLPQSHIANELNLSVRHIHTIKKQIFPSGSNHPSPF
jgi:hypothetical protein